MLKRTETINARAYNGLEGINDQKTQRYKHKIVARKNS